MKTNFFKAPSSKLVFYLVTVLLKLCVALRLMNKRVVEF